MLEPGDKAPSISLIDQNEVKISPKDTPKNLLKALEK